MRLSSYNHFVSLEDGSWLGFNHRTTLMARFNPHVYGACLAPHAGDPSRADPALLPQLKEGGFVVVDDFDEPAAVRQGWEARLAELSTCLGISILPTLDCNFRCVYCYEGEQRRPERMSRAVARQVVEFVESRVAPNIERIAVFWFGGEPLLELDTIDWLTGEIRGLCRRMGLEYSAALCTNGYLLTPEHIPRVRGLGISRLQVTLDGLRDHHDRRRPLRDGRGTFDRIAGNLLHLGDGFQLSVRLSVDRDNIEQVTAAHDWLVDEGIVDRARVYLARIDPSLAPACAGPSDCLTGVEYGSILLDRFRAGWLRTRLPVPYPELRYGLCSATNPSAWVIEPQGTLQRCLQCVGDTGRVVGDIWRGQNEAAAAEWFTLDPMKEERCRRCAFMPHCFGGCRYSWLRAGGPQCTYLRHRFDDWLRLQYLRRLSGAA